jgi:hypothetical protein
MWAQCNLWFVSELHEKYISNVMVQCRYSSIFYDKLPWFVSELPEKDTPTWWSSVGSILQ